MLFIKLAWLTLLSYKGFILQFAFGLFSILDFNFILTWLCLWRKLLMTENQFSSSLRIHSDL